MYKNTKNIEKFDLLIQSTLYDNKINNETTNSFDSSNDCPPTHYS